MTIARFLASMFMHINVEKDVKQGINMMKYAFNHHENFTNVYAAFMFGLLQTIICIIVEFNVMLILTTIPDVITVIMKYVSLAAIANIPRFYYASLTSEHMLVKVKDMKLDISVYRTEHEPLANASKNGRCCLIFIRLIGKMLRLLYTSWSYYFMPFTAVFLNATFMISKCKCWGDNPM